MASTAAAKEGGKEKFLVLPILVLILAQMGTSGDNGALSLAATALTPTSVPPSPTSSSPTWSIPSWPAPS